MSEYVKARLVEQVKRLTAQVEAVRALADEWETDAVGLYGIDRAVVLGAANALTRALDVQPTETKEGE